MEVIWTRLAINNLNNHADFIAKDDAIAAEKWVLSILEKTGQLSTHPQSGRIVPEFSDSNLREIIDGNYRLIYRIRVNKIFVQSVRHTRQTFRK